LKIVDVEIVDGAPCDKAEGRNAQGETVTLWIDKASSLVRKIFLTSKIPGALVEQTMTYRPQVDVEIAADDFSFDPAAGSKRPQVEPKKP
jgi:hypothetical protein